MTAAAAHISAQLALITRANREHSAAGATVLGALAAIRREADGAARGVAESRRLADGLRARTAALDAVAAALGRAGPKPRPRKGKA
jgi:methyl-accepting chemotaxis protein